MRTRSELKHYQSDLAIPFIKEKKRCALWMGMGLGKTVCTLTSAADLMDEFDIRKVLIVAPLRVAIDTWPKEVLNWEHIKHLRVSVIVGDQKKRKKALAADADVYVINVENLPWLENMVGLKGKLPWQMIVPDESSAFKDRDTMRFKTMRRLSARTDYIVELTATPASKSYLNLWSQYYIIDRGERLGETFTGYKQRYFDFVEYPVKRYVLKKGAKEVIEDRIRDITLVMRSRDYLDMQELMPPNDVEVELSESEFALYEKMERDCVLEFEDKDIEVNAVNQSALTQKLTQLANGRVYDAEKKPVVIHNRKLDALKELVEMAGEEPLLVAYSHQCDRDMILTTFPGSETVEKNPTKLQEQISRWNRKEIPMLVVHPASAGHGLNLQFGGHLLIFYGLIWSYELYLQLIGRLDRQGQTEPVRIWRIIAKNTIDEDIVKVLSGNEAMQDALLEAMKRRVDHVKFPASEKS